MDQVTLRRWNTINRSLSGLFSCLVLSTSVFCFQLKFCDWLPTLEVTAYQVHEGTSRQHQLIWDIVVKIGSERIDSWSSEWQSVSVAALCQCWDRWPLYGPVFYSGADICVLGAPSGHIQTVEPLLMPLFHHESNKEQQSFTLMCSWFRTRRKSALSLSWKRPVCEILKQNPRLEPP